MMRNALICVVWVTVATALTIIAGAFWMVATEASSLMQRSADDAAAASWNLRTATWNLALASADYKTVTTALADKRTGVARTLRNINTVTAQIGRTSNVVRLAASDERDQQAKAAEALMENLGALKTLIDQTGAGLNGKDGTLPALTADLHKVGDVLETLSGDGGLVKTGTAAVAKIGNVAGNSDIPRAFTNLADASVQTNGAMTHLNGTAAEMEEGVGYVRDSLKPRKLSFWQNVENAALSFIPGVVVQFFLRWRPQNVNVVNGPKP
jgi:hypothetical protein